MRISAANGAIGIERGRLVAPNRSFELELHIPDGLLYPGLTNAHDHLHRNHYGRLGAPPYADAYEWGRAIHECCAREIAEGRAIPRRDALLHGAWKNLLAGVTTVLHHDSWEPEFDREFPLRIVRLRNAHSLGFGGDLEGLDDRREPFCIHVAEGTSEAAAEEVRQLERRGLLNERLLAVHVVGADADGVQRLRASGAAVVWCPTSNNFLFGRTAPAALLAPGMDVLLGSDSLLTGAGTLLDELRAAALSGLVAESRLQDAVGVVAARRLGLAAPTLAPGARADLVILRRPLLQAGVGDVVAVVANGVLRVLDPAVIGSGAPSVREPGARFDASNEPLPGGPLLGWLERSHRVTLAGVTRLVHGPLPATGSLQLHQQASTAAPPGT